MSNPLWLDIPLLPLPDSGEPPLTVDRYNTQKNLVLQGGVSQDVYNPPVPSDTGLTTADINSTYYGTPPVLRPKVSISKTTGVSHAVDYRTRLKQIEWSRGYLWDCYISPAPPAPFNNAAYGLPVIDVSDAVAIGQSYDMNAGTSTYRFPYRKTFFDIKLTFLDDVNGTMETYFENWFNQTYMWDGLSDGGNGTINFLTKISRELKVTKLDSKRRAIYSRNYLVYPEGTVYGYNNNESNVRSFSVILVVVGYLGKG